MPTYRHTLIRLSGASTRSPYFSARGFQRPIFPSDSLESNSISVTEIDATDADLIDLNRDPDVVGVPRSFPTALITPTTSSTTALSANSNAVTWGLNEIGAATSTFNGAGVKVAVLDTGIDAAHPAFFGVSIDQNDFTSTGNGDGNGHGTHCAGTIFGRNLNGTRIGVARGVTDAMIGKVLDKTGRGDSAMLFKAIAWAINGGANVVSMSIGFDFPGYVEYLHRTNMLPISMATSIALRDYTANLRAFDALMAFAASQVPFTGGSVVVAASGNESNHPNFPISASVPSAANGVISVGAVGLQSNGVEIATFSNTDCQLVAPGVNVLSAKLGGGTVEFDGTSMACPHAAGVAALWWQAQTSQGLPANATSVTAKLLANANKSRIIGYSPVLHGNGLVKTP